MLQRISCIELKQDLTVAKEETRDETAVPTILKLPRQHRWLSERLCCALMLLLEIRLALQPLRIYVGRIFAPDVCLSRLLASFYHPKNNRETPKWTLRLSEPQIRKQISGPDLHVFILKFLVPKNGFPP